MFRFPFGTVQELNLDWFLEQWEVFKQEAQTAFDGIDHALDAEIQRVEDAMTDLYAARDAAIAAKDDALGYAQSANSSATNAGTSAGNALTQATNAARSAGQAAQSAGQAAQAITDAHNEALQAAAEKYLAQAWATGYRGSAPVAPVDPQYHNNSRYYAEYISRAWANGTNADGNVPASDPAYHNNAKYWSDIAKGFYEDTLALIESLPADVTEILELYETLAPLSESEELNGDVVEFDSSFSGAPLKKVETTLSPVQAGSGDPSSSNIRPISGWTDCKVLRYAENLLSLSDIRVGRLTSNGGFNADTTTRCATLIFIPVTGSTKYTIATNAGVQCIAAHYYSDAAVEAWISRDAFTGQISTFTTPANCTYIRVMFAKNNTEENIAPADITTAILAQSAVYPITFPAGTGTVYGGNIILNEDGTGELIITDAEIASYNGETLPSTWISDRDVYAAGTSPTNGAQVVYKLATPLSPIPLTAPQITTLKSINNLWASPGNIAVTAGDYIETITANLNNGIPAGILGAPEETDFVATRNYAVNDFVVINKTLYKVTAVIANGGAITPGTNVVATTICGELTALLNT